MPLSQRARPLLTGLLAAGLLGSVALAAPVVGATSATTQPNPITFPAVTSSGAGVENVTSSAFGETAGAATTYPLTVNVNAPENAALESIYVQVRLTHQRWDDVDLMLVSPSGNAVTLVSDAGGTTSGTRYAYFHETHAAAPDDAIDTPDWYGVGWRPTDHDTDPDDSDAFPAPAPASAPASFEALYGTSPAGAWSLFAVDDTDGSVGSVDQFYLSANWNTSATPRPSTVLVAGQPAGVTDVDLTLHDLDLDGLAYSDLILESPDGRRAHVLGQVGGTRQISDVTLVLDDEAAEPMAPTTEPVSGRYRPKDNNGCYYYCGTRTFVGDIDADGVPTPLSTFDGIDPNGTWRLYAARRYSGSVGTISGGWSLDITTVDAPSAPVISSPTDGATDTDGTVTLAGTADPRATVRVTEGAERVATTVTSDAGAWKATVTDLTAGAHTFAAVAVDRFGNVSSPTSLVVTVVVPATPAATPPATPTVIPAPSDTKAPKVASFSPKEGAAKVGRDSRIKVRFSEAMDDSTLSGKTVKLASGGERVKATMTYRAADRTLLISPTGKLDAEATFRLTIKRGTTDEAGLHLRNVVTWKFTTA